MIPIRNVYYMLVYAYKALFWHEFKNLSNERFDNIDELYSEILAKGMAYQIKRGIQRDYINQTEDTSTIHGKLNVSESIKTQAILRRRAVCTFDDFSVNSRINQVVKAAMNVLYRHLEPKSPHRKNLIKILALLDEVDDVNIHTIDWNFHYNRNNELYRLLVGISYLAIHRRILAEQKGATGLANLFDDQKMCDLYEHFILNFFKRHYPGLRPSPLLIDWSVDDNFSELLPVMKTDITLTGPTQTLVVDAKYYESGILKSNTRYLDSPEKLSSGNMYQIYTYVKNMDKNHTGNVSGMLLYAKTTEARTPDHKYSIDGNIFYARCLDLNKEFEDIAAQLRQIAELVYGNNSQQE